MSDVGRNDPCPGGSGLKYKQCHGSANPPSEPHSAPLPPAAAPPAPGAVENPFKRIFHDDGTLNEQYVLSRLQHFEGLSAVPWRPLSPILRLTDGYHAPKTGQVPARSACLQLSAL